MSNAVAFHSGNNGCCCAERAVAHRGHPARILQLHAKASMSGNITRPTSRSEGVRDPHPPTTMPSAASTHQHAPGNLSRL
ncbi:hypothetical protein BDW02DRAFT_114527 [Decorospora gaudefroyi]|uniref:Uncharacterized protein n=1 Tax=Decorospora gaudefroyi TaxID=184978 RepID=A0A6A5K1K2_9PLEO|nr:hypothetical protein BDW02DRAFT_114527 [Decorospora gaudefroyi]